MAAAKREESYFILTRTMYIKCYSKSSDATRLQKYSKTQKKECKILLSPLLSIYFLKVVTGGQKFDTLFILLDLTTVSLFILKKKMLFSVKL